MGARCPFCDRGSLEERMIIETAGFAVIPTFGQIVEGYALIVPKRHTICFGDLSDTEMDEAGFLMKRVRQAITRAYGQAPIFFEHGIVGQTVKHAHMHAVPATVDLFPLIVADFPEYERVSSLTAMQGTFQREGPYLYYENAGGEAFVFHIFKWPQYLRIVLAKAMGYPERADWKTMDKTLDQTMILETWKKLRAELE